MDNKAGRKPLDAERKWRYMVPLSHQFLIYGRKAVESIWGAEAGQSFERRFWEMAGDDTARLYLERGKLDPSDLVGLVEAMARSSEIMGEDADVRIEGDRVYLVHHACPWPADYAAYGIGESCQRGCDTWFECALARVSPQFHFKTLRSIPGGGGECLREFWKGESE